jgi:hypothetical protein
LRRFGISALGRPALACLPLPLERRRMAYPKAQDYADFRRGLQQRFAIGEMAFNINLRNPERSLSAFGLGCSLIPGARRLCRRRMLRCLGLSRFTACDNDRAIRIATIEVSLLLLV